MANRQVKVELLLATAGYMQGVERAAVKTRELGSEAEKLAAKREMFNTLGTAAVGFGAAVGAGVAFAVSKFAEFDAQMSSVQAATHETAANMELLREAAIDAGARTVYSATEAAQAIEELSKAGISTADILGGALDGSLDLAAAGNIAVADAAEIAASAMTQFGLKGQDVTHVADLLAAGAGKAQGGVAEMSQALNQSGLVAAQMGLSLDETVGTLTQFASAGLLGSDAGTSFRNMLLRLANPTKEAAAQMEQLGLDFYDAQGDFIGMEGVAGQLQSRLAGLTQEERNAALANLFGQDAIRAASILYEGGADSVQKWADAVNDAGYASETAAQRLDNLKGDWEEFTGALDSALIGMGEGADGPLRTIVQELTSMVNMFNDLPDWAQQSTLAVGALASAVALGGGAFMLAVPKVAAYNAAIATMGPNAQRASRAVGALAKVGAAGAGFLTLAKGAEIAAKTLGQMGDGAKSANETMKLLLAQDFDGLFDGVSTSVTDLDEAFAKLFANDWGSAFNRFGSDALAWTGFTSSVGEAREQFSLMGDALAEMVNRGDADRAAALFDELAARAEAQGWSVEQLNEVMPQYQDALAGVANESELAASAAGVAAGGIAEMETAAAGAEQVLSDVAQALDDIAGTAMSMGEANDAALSAINALRDASEEADASLHGTNDASIQFRESLRGVETAARDSAQAILDNGGTLDEALAAWQRSREEVIRARVAKGEDRAEAIRWADQNLGSAAQVRDALTQVTNAIERMPTKKHIQVTVDTSQASRGLNQWITSNSGRVIRVRVAADGGSIDYGGRIVSPNATGNLYENGVLATGFASGGIVPGVYPATPGGIHRFAEAGFAEAYVTTDPKYRDRSIDIVQEMAGRLGMWEQGSMMPAAPVVQVTAPSTVPAELVVRDVDGSLVGRMRVEATDVVRAAVPSKVATRSRFGR